MAKERCLGCRATLPADAAFCPSCGRPNSPVLLDDVTFTDAEGTTVDLGDRPGRRWLTIGAVVAVIAAVVGVLAMVGAGEETVAEPEPTTSTTIASTTTTTRSTTTRPTTTTVPEPLVKSFEPLIPGVTTGRRIAVLGGGEIREIDLDNGWSSVVASEVRGESLRWISGSYLVGKGAGLSLWQLDRERPIADTGQAQLLPGGLEIVGVVDWSRSETPRVRLIDGSGAEVAVVDPPPGLWPAAIIGGQWVDGVTDDGSLTMSLSIEVVAQTDGNGVFVVDANGSIRRLGQGRLVGVWNNGVQVEVCDDGFRCVVESRTLAGEVVASGPPPIPCCYWIRASSFDVVVYERDGLTEIATLDGQFEPVVTNGYQQSLEWWPDGQAMVMFDGTDISVFDRATRTVHRLQLPDDFPAVTAVAAIP